MPKTNDDALDAFIAAKNDIDVLLARLTAYSADHFGYSPEEVHWGHVGMLAQYRTRLREITDMAFCEGEHAAWASLPTRRTGQSASPWPAC